MARISLRAYDTEIEAMIDRDLTDEAIVHCRHILERYPKHINTYRLLGKALLEGEHFADAADLFHRVLSSIPDDFIAHLGMSIIREDEGNIDAAIWHMERSFEVQPSNAAVQVELRRLYNLRDGVSPQKIQLTRGALARMSAKSHLYSQAIAELRAALSDDPQRPDLQVLLARVYAQSGSQLEAIETCNTLLSKLPYCFEANRILAEILPETERAEKAQEFRNRVIELDPYYAHLSEAASSVDEVTDSAVTLEHLEYSEEFVETSPADQPEWATALGVNIDEEPAFPEETAQWMVTEPDEMLPEDAYEEEEGAVIVSGSDEIQPDEEQEEQLPDWMQEADEEEQVGLESEVKETPEWLREVMEGPGAAEEAAAAGLAMSASEQHEDADIPMDEIEPMGEESTPEEDLIEEVAVESMPPQDEIPEEEEEKELPIGEPETLSGPSMGTAVAGVVLGAALEDDESHEIEDTTEEELEEEHLQPELAAAELEVSSFEPDIEEEPSVGEPEVPPSMQDLGEGIPEEEAPEDLEMVDEIEEEGALVFESPAEGVGEPAEYEFTEVEEVPESADLPVEEAVSAEEDVAQEPAVSEEMLPEIEYEAEVFEPETPVEVDVQPGEDEFADSLPEWLSTVAIDEGEIFEPGIVETDKEDIVRAEIPDWLKRMEEQHLAEMAAASVAVETIEDLELGPDFTDLSGEDVPSWLMSAMEVESPEKAAETLPVAEIEDIIPAPVSAEIEQEVEEYEEEMIPEAAGDVEEISEEILTEEIFEEPIGEELETEVPALEIPEEEVVITEGDTQPVILEGMGEISEAEEEIQPEEMAESEPAVEEALPEEIAEMELAEEEPLVEEISEAELLVEEAPQEEIAESELVEEEVQPEEIVEPELAEEEPLVEEITEAELLVEEALPEEIAEPELVEEGVQPEEIVEMELAEEEPLVEEITEAELLVEEALPEEIAEPELVEEGVQPEEIVEPELVEEEVQPEEISEPELIEEEVQPEEFAEPELVEEEVQPEEIVEPELVEADVQLEEIVEPEIAEQEALLEEIVEAEPELIAQEVQPEEITEPEPVEVEIEQIEEIQALEEIESITPEAELIEELEPETTEAEEVAGITAEAPLSSDDEEAAIAWLESLAARQGAAEEELLTEPEKRLEEPPEWIREEALEVEQTEEIEKAKKIDEIAEAAAAAAAIEALSREEEPEAEPTPFDEEITPEKPAEWIPEIEEEIEAEEIVLAEGVEQPAEEIPEWITALAQEEITKPEFQTTDWSPDMLVEEAEPEQVVEPELKTKIDLNAASLAQLEKIPGVGFIHAQNIINHRASSGPFKSLDELDDIHGLTPDVIQILRANLSVELVPEVSPPLSAYPELQNAWDSINSGDIATAVDQYSQLIKKDEHLDEVIRDLQEALGKFPADQSLYQTLGDAYLHANMLREALDAYHRAEDLIT